MARRVSARLGKNVFSDSAPTSIEGVIEHVEQGWRAHVYMRGADGRLAGVRHLSSEGTDCAALDAAATLVIALAIDPEAALRPPSEGNVRSPDAAPAPTDIRSATPPPPAADAPAPAKVLAGAPVDGGQRPYGAELTGRALMGAGLLPQASAGLGLSAEMAIARPLYASVGAAYWPEVRTPAGDVAFGITAGWAGGCVRADGARTGASLCGKLLLGAIHSVVFTLEPTEPGDRLWAGAALSAQARLRLLGRLIAELGVEGIVPVTRDPFLVQGRSAPVFQQAPIAGVAFAGLGLSIP
jgi:hypothetical protein